MSVFAFVLFLLLVLVLPPIVLGFIAGILETRLVWPYVVPTIPEPREEPQTDLSTFNPYAAPTTPSSADHEPELSDYSASVGRQASRQGYRNRGLRFHGKRGLYKLRYDFWLSNDRLILVTVASGTLAGVKLDCTRLLTRLDDQRGLVTLDDSKGRATGTGGLIDQVILTKADFEELESRHRARLAQTHAQPLSFSESDPLSDYQQFFRTVVDRLVDTGWARYLDDRQETYKYTMKGAFLAALFASASEWRRVLRDGGRGQIRRPGEPGYQPSSQRRGRLQPWLERIRFVCWILMFLGIILSSSRGPAVNRTQAMFRSAIPLVGLLGVVGTWLLGLVLRFSKTAADD